MTIREQKENTSASVSCMQSTPIIRIHLKGPSICLVIRLIDHNFQVEVYRLDDRWQEDESLFIMYEFTSSL